MTQYLEKTERELERYREVDSIDLVQSCIERIDQSMNSNKPKIENRLREAIVEMKRQIQDYRLKPICTPGKVGRKIDSFDDIKVGDIVGYGDKKGTNIKESPMIRS